MPNAMTQDDAEVASWPPVPSNQHFARPTMVPMKPWWQNPMFQQLGQGVQAAAQGLRNVQAMQPADVMNQQALNPDEALKQLRMERARQSWERRFGSPHSGGQSMASQGQQDNINALIQRIQMARQMHNWRPG